MFYNEDHKKSYIETLKKEKYSETYIDSFIALFNKSYKYEKQFGKDLLKFNAFDIIEMFKGSNNSFDKQVEMFTLIKEYLPKNDILVKEDISIVRKYLVTIKPAAKLVVPIEYNEIKGIVNDIKYAADKFLIYGLFCGIMGNDLIELSFSTMDDSDEQNKVIWLAGKDSDTGEINYKAREYVANDELFNYAKLSCESDSYISTSDRARYERTYKVEQDGENFILKRKKMNYKDLPDNPTPEYEIENGRCMILARYNKIKRRYDILKNKRPADIFWSGLVYNVKKLALVNDIDILCAKDVLRIPGFNNIREQYGLKTQDRSILNNLKRYF